MNSKSTRVTQKERLKKRDEVTEALQESEYWAVIAVFLDNEHLQFVSNMLVGLRHLGSDVISDLMNLDDAVEDDDIQASIVSHLSQWTETIGTMVRILEVSRDRAWKVLDEIDGVGS
jgi:hypothetical protein